MIQSFRLHLLACLTWMLPVCGLYAQNAPAGTPVLIALDGPTTSTLGSSSLTPLPSSTTGSSQTPILDSKEILAPGSSRIIQEISLDYSYVGPAGARAHADAGGTHFGDMAEQTSRIGYGLSIPLATDLKLETGITYHRIDFDNPGNGSALPDSLSAVGPTLGLRYKVDSNWAVFGRFTTEFENVNDWGNSNYVRYTGAIGSTWNPNKDFDLTFGLALNPGSVGRSPVLPVGALKWHFDNDWTLSLGFPRTAIEYKVDDQWKVWFGPSFEGGLFKTGSGYGNASGQTMLNDQLFQYQEVRVGFGTEYRLRPWLVLQAQAGADVYREFSFENVSYRVQIDPAPYGSLGLKLYF